MNDDDSQIIEAVGQLENSVGEIQKALDGLKASQGAIIAHQGMIQAEIRAIRDAVCDLLDKQELVKTSGNKFYADYARHVDEYYQTIERDPQRLLEHVNAAIVNKPQSRSA
jgi:regulator of replication initiation timing